ncbi:unnamed protein product [Rotaria sp. Silwood1]|nr:unnamed protein product [Rotaria sp. Silwood1]CAF3542195.1 unnamed protein product [Rotaria sp. Silwood1]CAF3568896.1 unnamed protein product [Rotaria sp. Silwood1]CAF3607772.1 unnamed protein product [Rotaria sp. Silwood1]CAF4698383.1 unnamed protein product [Rotaria sp. Silwood1]
MGFSQFELNDYFTGSAFLAWLRMDNLQKHAAPLSNSWHQLQFQLVKQTIQRMTDIGITPTINLLNLISHYYACDLFNEMTPPISDLEYLTDVNVGIFQIMQTVDSKAVWVMQACLFLSSFWTIDRVRNYLSKVPIGRLILLDLYSETLPQYLLFESFYGHYYI